MKFRLATLSTLLGFMIFDLSAMYQLGKSAPRLSNQALTTLRAASLSTYSEKRPSIVISDTNLSVRGSNANVSSDRNKVVLSGPENLNVEDSTLSKLLVTPVRHLTLSRSIASSIRIQKPGISTGQQVLELDGSTVRGDIIFEKKGGKIILRNGAQIKGSVEGADIEKI